MWVKVELETEAYANVIKLDMDVTNYPEVENLLSALRHDLREAGMANGGLLPKNNRGEFRR